MLFLEKFDGHILQIRMDQMGDHIKMNFEYFQIQKWMLQTVRAEKIDEKNWVICHYTYFHVSFFSYGPQIVQKSTFYAILCWPQQEIQVWY